MIRQCKDCGKNFEPTTHNNVYCKKCGSCSSRSARKRRIHPNRYKYPYIPIDQLNPLEANERRLKAREYKWKHQGIRDASIKFHDKLKKQQHNLCAICGNPPKKRALALDHDHKTGEVRGLLCFRCNYGLPWFEWFNSTPERLQETIKYLNVCRRVTPTIGGEA
jgi:hypothetical protein